MAVDPLMPPKPIALPRNPDGSIRHPASALEKATAEKESLTPKNATAQPIIIHQPAAPPVVLPPAQNSPGVTLKIRNDESSYSAMVTNLFDHPQTHSMVKGL
jgi:hypothetical protein